MSAHLGEVESMSQQQPCTEWQAKQGSELATLFFFLIHFYLVAVANDVRTESGGREEKSRQLQLHGDWGYDWERLDGIPRQRACLLCAGICSAEAKAMPELSR